MPAPLWFLMWLNAAAVARRLRRSLRTWKGIGLACVGVGLLGLWIAPSVWLNHARPPTDPAVVRTVGPLAVLLMCVLNVVTSAGDRAVAFTPAEVDFLFPGPFTRRQLLAYKLVKTGLAAVPAAALFGLVMGRYGGTFAGRAVAAWLLMQFVQLVAMVAALARSSAGERAFTTGRRWVLAGLVAGLAIAAVPVLARQSWDDPRAVAAAVNSSAAGRIVLAPFGVFARAVVANRLGQGVLLDAVAVGIVGGLVGIVFVLDANYLETAADASAKRYAAVARLRRSGLAGTAKSARWRVAMLPWLGGAGPIAWRQLTAVVRTSRGLLMLLGLIAVVAGGLVGRSAGPMDAIPQIVGVSVWVNLFLTQMLRFDFRGDIDHLDALRALPLHPVAVAAAEVVAPTLVLSAVQALLIGAMGVIGHLPVPWLVAAGAFAVPVNALLVGTENLIFLWFPSRPAVAVAGDMGGVGRQTVVFLARLIAVGVVLAVAGAVGGAAGFVCGRSVVVGATVAWVVVTAAVVGVVWVMGVAFARFDPSVDTPA